MFFRTESERSFIIFLCFPFLRVQEELVETNWYLLARRRRYKGHFPPGGIFRAERYFLLFKDQLAESGSQKTKENIIPRGKFHLVENGLKCRHDMLKVARHEDDHTICQWWYDIPVVVLLSVSVRLKRKIKTGRVWDPRAGRYEVSISFN